MPIPQKPLEETPKTAKERVYIELRKWIVEGTLKPEEKISDQEISQYFEVSRTPVREAVQMLADQKLVNVYPGKETRVAPIDLDGAFSIYKIMAELHALAVEFSYPGITPQVIENLKKINERFAGATKKKDVRNSSIYDQEFHQTFLKLADNHFLTEFEDTLENHIRRIENLFYSCITDDDSNSVEEHQRIIAALEESNLASAKEYMRENWLSTLNVLGKLKSSEM
ncbi:MAG: GntR family transcriptional regulator [Clostridiales bacterium]|nr:GntR family transcriptional regulator [Clostridiales bacterium]